MNRKDGDECKRRIPSLARGQIDRYRVRSEEALISHLVVVNVQGLGLWH
jgi:hypothetical protein